MVEEIKFKLKFNRKIKDGEYISPGSFNVQLKNGDWNNFDFEVVAWNRIGNGQTINVACSSPDLESFPDTAVLDPEQIAKFGGIWIYLDDTSEDLQIDSMSPMTFYMDDGREIAVSTEEAEFWYTYT